MAQVLAAPSAHETQAYFSPTSLPQAAPPLRKPQLIDHSPLPSPARSRSPSPDRTASPERQAASSRTSVSASPRASYQYFPRTSIQASQPGAVSETIAKDDEEISFPSYDDSTFHQDPEPAPSLSPDDSSNATSSSANESATADESSASSPGFRPVADDTAVRDEPTLQVDYLSHEWQEEDIWCSWKHIKSNRKTYGATSRLENASWRTWTKAKYKLKTVSPETLNWLKDCDVTWLYGPLQKSPCPRRIVSEPASRLSKSNSFLNKKPILKKRSVSEVMLQKSLSSSSLIKQAAAAVQAQRSSDSRRGSEEQSRFSRTPSDFINSEAPLGPVQTAPNTMTFPSSPSSGLQSPESGRRHIRFDNKVEQCIAVDFKQGNGYDDNIPSIDDESSDDGLVMMKPKIRKTSSAPGSSRGSFSQESKGIAMLPATTLKFLEDDPDCPGHPENDKPFGSSWRSPRLPSSPSQETLRPTRPSNNFLIDYDEEGPDAFWEPAGAFGKARSDTPMPLDRRPLSSEDNDDNEKNKGLRRTPSGMFMPFDDEEEERFTSTGFLGRAVDTVNTFRDIAHVIWNVGWRK